MTGTSLKIVNSSFPIAVPLTAVQHHRVPAVDPVPGRVLLQVPLPVVPAARLEVPGKGLESVAEAKVPMLQGGTITKIKRRTRNAKEKESAKGNVRGNGNENERGIARGKRIRKRAAVMLLLKSQNPNHVQGTCKEGISKL